MAKYSESKHKLKKKEREKLIQGLKTASGEILLQRVVNCLSEEPHLQQNHERKELMISSEREMKIICDSLALTFITPYKKVTR